MILDLESGQGYRRYQATHFRAGLKLLLEQVPELRKALAIRGLERAPTGLSRLVKLVGHLHGTGQLPAGLSCQIERPDGVQSVLLAFKSGLRIGIQAMPGLDKYKKHGPTLFFYRLPEAPVLVYTEGLSSLARA